MSPFSESGELQQSLNYVTSRGKCKERSRLNKGYWKDVVRYWAAEDK